MKIHQGRLRILFLMIIFLTCFWLISPDVQPVQAGGYIDFEEGIDRQKIESSIPGLHFTTTDDQDWIYGDWRTMTYNGPYPNGAYYSNGNFFAWLGENQGKGRIDFTEGDATYLQVNVSSAYGLTGEAYDKYGQRIAISSVPANLNTGRMERLRLDAPGDKKIAYVELHDTGNYWLIDDLSTDASGVPATRPPVVLIPGIMGSVLNVRNVLTGNEYEIWPPMYNSEEKKIELTNLPHFNPGALFLASNGSDPLFPNHFVFSTSVIENFSVEIAGIPIHRWEQRHYDEIIQHLEDAGFTVYAFHYDWRRDVRSPLSGQGPNQARRSLEKYIDWVLADSGAEQVNIVAHSLGGLVTRSYISASEKNANKVEQAIIVGTPYLGAPQALKGLRSGIPNFTKWPFQIPGFSDLLRGLTENFPSLYQVIPSARYNLVNGGNWFWYNGLYLNPSQTINFVKTNHNSDLMKMGEELHNFVDYWDPMPGNVPFRFIVGSGIEGTTGLVREMELPGFMDNVRIWDLVPTNGDGTVPLVSASLEGNGYNFRGDVPIWYADKVDHGELVREKYILDFIVALLATPPYEAAVDRAIPSHNYTDSEVHSLYLGDVGAFSAKSYITGPPTPPEMSKTPFPIHGAQVSVYYAIALHLYDSQGNHTGPTSDGFIEMQIPGSSYEDFGYGIFATVPAGDTYEVVIEPDGSRPFDLRVRDIEGLYTQFIQRTITYMGVALDIQSRAFLAYNPDDSLDEPILGLDIDGDGIIDEYMNPTSIVDAEESYDFDPPSSSIQLQGTTDIDGWYTGSVYVTISATDAESGVAQIDYTLDSGETIEKYDGPFYVIAEEVPVIYAQAIDRAGNREIAESIARLRPSISYIYLPVVFLNR